jgi:4-amino-4-deoxy-L-arabinose transferase-like glycosyltransferase
MNRGDEKTIQYPVFPAVPEAGAPALPGRNWLGDNPEISLVLPGLTSFSGPAPGMPTLKWVFWLGGLFVAAHLALQISAGLSVDEAHYALYAYRLDWSYFDHPPLAGWVQLPALALGGADFLVREAAFLLWLATLFLLRRLVAALYPGSAAGAAANAAALLFLSAPLFELLGVALLPDSLLVPIACCVMAATWRIRSEGDGSSLAAWLALGFSLGLAGLSKYTGIFLAVSALLVLLPRFGPRLFAQPGFWIAAVLALALVSPVLAWNARHGWISFAYQARHAVGAESGDLGGVAQFVGSHAPPGPAIRGPGWDWLGIAGAEAAQVIGYGPLLVLGVCLGIRARFREPGTRHCLAFAGPPMVVIAALAARGGSLPHWTAFAWTALVPVAAAGVAIGLARPSVRRWIIGLGLVQVVALTAGFAAAWAGGPPGRAVVGFNPFADLYGWDGAVAEARELAATHRVDSLCVLNWTLASRAAWYARPLPVHVLDRRFDQFTLWYGKLPKGGSAILIDWSPMAYDLPPAGSPGWFRRVRKVGERTASRFGRTISRFDFYLCEDWQGGADVRRR